TDQATRSDGCPSLPGTFACRTHSAVRQDAAFVGGFAVHPEGGSHLIREIEFPAVARSPDAYHQGAAKRFPSHDRYVGVQFDGFGSQIAEEVRVLVADAGDPA